MSTVWTSLLLLSFTLYLSFPSGSHGALVVSSDNHPEESDGNVNRILKKRSVKMAKVEVSSVKIDCKVASRFAHTIMTSTALNTANTSREVFFEMDLPKTAFITNFTMEIGGRTYVGEVKEKEKAKKQYEKAVSTGQTAGLVRASGRKMEKFSVSVNIAANSSVTFTLTYEELLQRRFGKYELMIRVKPKQLVHDFQIVADIYEPQGIEFVDAYGTFISNELLPLVQKTVTDKKAHVSFSPTLDQQRTCPNCDGTLIDGDFFIKYDVKRPQDIGDVQIVNGYFVHFFAPAGLPRVPKNVIFCIDVSGSMHGNKIKQTREAMLTILGDLHEDDHFGIVLFESSVTEWKKNLTKATPENVQAAQKFVQTLLALGGTELHGGVMRSIDLLRKNVDVTKNSVSMIILLTDGDPTSALSLADIQSTVRDKINGTITLFSLGFGNNVNFNFLDVLAKQNDGFARKIYEASDAALQLQGFYDEVASPLLSEVQFHYPENSVNSLTNSHFKQLFGGSEIVVAGQMNDVLMNDFPIEVSAKGSEDDFLVKGQASALDWNSVFPDQEYIFGDFTERLWAYLTIQQLLENKDKAPAEEKENITAKALDLSLRYNFVTPLTSMVVTKPQDEDKPEDTLVADKLTEDQRRIDDQLSQSYSTLLRHSYQPPSQPAYFVDNDPHFVLELPDRNDALCFNIDEKVGTVFNLLNDPVTGIVVNGQTIGDKKVDPAHKLSTYFGRFGIVHEKFGIRIVVSTKEILVSEHNKQMKLHWTDNASIKGPNMDLHVSKDRSLTVTLRNSVRFVIILHKVWKLHPYHQDFLGFYTLDAHLLSHAAHGLLGQFYKGIEFEVSDVFPGQDEGKPDAVMLVKGHNLTVTRGWQRDFRRDVKNGEKVPCWFIHHNAEGLIDGTHSDYIVPQLFSSFHRF